MSYVVLTDIKRLIREEAKNQVVMSPYNVVYDGRRLIAWQQGEGKSNRQLYLSRGLYYVAWLSGTDHEHDSQFSSMTMSTIAFGVHHRPVNNGNFHHPGTTKLFKGSSACYGFLSDNTIVEIYSCKTNSWRRTKYEFIPYVTSRGLFLNGSLHWLVGRDRSDLDSMIVSFNVADETFGRLVSPLLLDLDTVLEGIMILEDCLFVYPDNWTGFKSFTFEGWILRDYPVKSSWTRYCSFLIEESPAQHYL
ncbi:uncharacterized protein LOC116214428 [Punica granatum]|uniref:Uncharacterized protein LOC116214428 n=1 Tax=Punica granatum TaxID=22663 RepID=A0A6P8EFX3_PUNGR|nr:uncharacterized protein LOC116214428 [Punica granatum]